MIQNGRSENWSCIPRSSEGWSSSERGLSCGHREFFPRRRNSNLVQRLRLRGAIPSLFHTSLWDGTQKFICNHIPSHHTHVNCLYWVGLQYRLTSNKSADLPPVPVKLTFVPNCTPSWHLALLSVTDMTHAQVDTIRAGQCRFVRHCVSYRPWSQAVRSNDVWRGVPNSAFLSHSKLQLRLKVAPNEEGSKFSTNQ